MLAKAQEWWRHRKPAERWRYPLSVCALSLAGWLVLAEKPWDIELPEKPKLRHLVVWGTWWGGAAGAAVLGLLAAICPWWAGRGVLASGGAQPPATPRWFWPLVLAAVVVAAAFGVQRLGFSLWDDEEMCARYSLVGKFRPDKTTGLPEMRKVDWEETLFDYRTPNNHVLHSVLSRACNEAWLAVVRPGGLPFSEVALRLPAFLFGLLAVVALAWFLQDLGWPGAGVLAAFLLAVHPWGIRYASEARGYSMVICLVVVLLAFWIRAVRGGEWRWWAACAATQFALLYTYPGTLIFLATINIFTIPVLAVGRSAAKPFRVQSGRWFCANSLAAVPALVLMLPWLPQAREYFEAEASRGIVLGWPWLRSAFSFLLAGVPWSNNNTAVAFGGFAQSHALVHHLLVAGALVALAVGTARFVRRGAPEGVVAVAILVTPLTTFLLSRTRGMLIYESYVIPSLPGLIALAATGLAWAACGALRLPGGRVLAPAGAGAAIVAFFAATNGFRTWLVQNPLQQIRESVLATREKLCPAAVGESNVLTASFCIPPYLYDAGMIRTDSVDEFIAILQQAEAEGRPLYVNIGMPWAAREYSPKMWSLLHESALFGDFRHFPGFDAGLDRIVARYRPGSAKTFDFTPYRGGGR